MKYINSLCVAYNLVIELILYKNHNFQLLSICIREEKWRLKRCPFVDIKKLISSVDIQ